MPPRTKPRPPVDVAEMTRALELCCADLAAALEAQEAQHPPQPSPVEPPPEMSQDAVDNLRWRPLLLAPLPGLDQLISIVKPPVQVIIALLNLIKALLEALAVILIGILDAFRALIEAAIALLTDIINDLLNTGVYMYVDVPGVTPTEASAAEMGFVIDPAAEWTAGQKLQPPPPPVDNYARWASRFAASFDDPGDPNRPIVTDGAPIQAVFIVMAAPSLDPIRNLIRLLGQLFNIDQFANIQIPTTPDPRRARARAMKGVAPDWRSLRLVDIIPPLRMLETLPEALRGLLTSLDTIAALVRQLAQAIEDKARVLFMIAQALQAILDLLEALKSTGMYVLPVSTTGGAHALAGEFLAAADRPPGGYIGGVCFMASGPNLAKAGMLWEMLGQAATMDALESELVLQAALAQAAAENAKVLEQPGGAGNPDDKFPSTVKDENAAFEQALVDAPDEMYDAVGQAKQHVLEAAARARVDAVTLLGDDTSALDPTIADGIAHTRQAQRFGARSLALGLAPRSDKPAPPPADVPDAPPDPPDDGGCPP